VRRSRWLWIFNRVDGLQEKGGGAVWRLVEEVHGLQKVLEYADGRGLRKFGVWEKDFVWAQGARGLIVAKHGVAFPGFWKLVSWGTEERRRGTE